MRNKASSGKTKTHSLSKTVVCGASEALVNEQVPARVADVVPDMRVPQVWEASGVLKEIPPTFISAHAVEHVVGALLPLSHRICRPHPGRSALLGAMFWQVKSDESRGVRTTACISLCMYDGSLRLPHDSLSASCSAGYGAASAPSHEGCTVLCPGVLGLFFGLAFPFVLVCMFI